MKQIQTPPLWREVLGETPAQSFALLTNPKAAELLRRADEKYLHWDEFRHRSMPDGLRPEQLWALIKLSRFPHLRRLPFKSKTGSPFKYSLPDVVQRALHDIDQSATGQLLVDDQPFSRRDRDRYIISSLMEEAIASSILEGAATTRKVAKEMLRTGRRPVSRGEKMILNNYRTMEKVTKLKEKSLSTQMLCDIQATITRDTLDDQSAAGRFRRDDEEVVVQDLSDGTVLHVPPPAGELGARMDALYEFANSTEGGRFIHPIVKASIIHFWIAYDHPFVDGNGRTARAIFYWYLLKHNYWALEYLPISRVILKAPGKYKRAFLYSETDDEDLTYFVIFNTRALCLAIRELAEYVSRKQSQLKETTALLKRIRGLNHRQKELIGQALRHPDSTHTIMRHTKTHGVVYQTARTDLFGLVRKGLLKKYREGRTWHFYPHEKLAKKLNLGP